MDLAEFRMPESRTSRSFLNIRLADMEQSYADWQAKGAVALYIQANAAINIGVGVAFEVEMEC